MKSSLLVLAALLMLATPAAAMSVEHGSNYADSSGSSKFNDPDDSLSGGDSSNQFGSIQFGNSGSFSMGVSGGSSENRTAPGYAMQGCMAAVCQR